MSAPLRRSARLEPPVLYRFVQASWDSCRYSGFREGEFESTTDNIILWLNGMGAVFTDSKDWNKPKRSKYPDGADLMIPYMPAYGMLALAHDIWRSPEIKEYAKSQGESELSSLRAQVESDLMCEADGYESKLWELTPDTFFCAFITTDDHTYGGGIIISSVLPAVKMRTKMKKAAEKLYDSIGMKIGLRYSARAQASN